MGTNRALGSPAALRGALAAPYHRSAAYYPKPTRSLPLPVAEVATPPASFLSLFAIYFFILLQCAPRTHPVRKFCILKKAIVKTEILEVPIVANQIRSTTGAIYNHTLGVTPFFFLTQINALKLEGIRFKMIVTGNRSNVKTKCKVGMDVGLNRKAPIIIVI